MSCAVIANRGAVFSVWGAVTTSDLRWVAETVRGAAERAGEPIFYMTRVPENAPAPDAEVRRVLLQLLPSVIESCASYHVILDGSGFSAALKRGVLVALFQVCGRRNTFFVHTSVDEMLAYVPDKFMTDVAALIQEARTKGLLVGRPRLSCAPSAQSVQPPA